jgi:polygalacturonase
MFNIYDVKKYGAVGDGQVLDTSAIQGAIDACSFNDGGTVYLSNGTYLIGTIYLKSNVTMYLEVSATLLGSTQADKTKRLEAAETGIMDRRFYKL